MLSDEEGDKFFALFMIIKFINPTTMQVLLEAKILL